MKGKTLFTNIRTAMVWFSVVLLIPLFIVCIILFSEIKYSQIYNEKNFKFVKASSIINGDLNAIVQNSSKIVSNTHIVNLYMKDYKGNMQENMEISELIKLYLSGYADAKSATMADMVIYNNNQTIYNNRFSQSLDRMPNPNIMDNQEFLNGNPVWVNEKNRFFLYRRFLQRDMKYEAVLCCTYSKSNIYDAFELFDIYSNEFIIDDKSINYNDNSIISEELVNGCKLSLLSITGLKKELYIRNSIVALPLLLVILLAIFILSTKTTKMLTAKIYRFIEQIESDDMMESIKQLETNPEDELHPVYERVKLLITEIREIDYQRALIEQDKKNIELQYVQSQINPHLLYNSLSILRWRSLEYDEKFAEIIDGLSDYYRLSISKPNQVIKFREEIRLIKRYIELISFTKNKKYALNIDFSTELLDEDTFKHILQPFVENSVIHGLVETENPEINICGAVKNNIIEIIIEDNGIGISSAALDGINKSDYQSLYESFGVKNTLTRLKYFYGDDSSIDVYNRKFGGAAVCMKFRKKQIEAREFNDYEQGNV